MKQTLFKDCPGCKRSWNSRNEFLTDAKVTLTDYRVNFMNLEKGQFLFEHVCGETLTLEVNELSDLYGGPIYQERKTDSDECPAYCLYVDSLEPCPEKCECAYAREILQLLR